MLVLNFAFSRFRFLTFLNCLEADLIVNIICLWCLNTLYFLHVLNESSERIFWKIAKTLLLLIWVLKWISVLWSQSVFFFFRPYFILIGQLLEKPHSVLQSSLHELYIIRLFDAILRRSFSQSSLASFGLVGRNDWVSCNSGSDRRHRCLSAKWRAS